jgi:putative peptide zinc metalloprotease protein
MQQAGKTFSESWYRVAGLKVRLHPTVTVRKQLFRGEIWYVLRDPFNNQFFRLRPTAHEFVIRLRPDRTVEEVWEECLERFPDDAPGQEDVIKLLTQLYFGNLLHFETPADSAKLFERYRKRRQREIRSKLMSIMFIRIPLFDPDPLLKRILPVFKHLISPIGAALWLMVVAAALKMVVDRFDMATSQVQGILAPDNLFLLYVGMVVIKSLHEFGHALVCRRFGGEVHTMGVMLLIFTPLPYMDATSSWSFRSRWQRALVGGAGMLTEVFIAALATFVWAHSGPGTLSSLAYNMMFIASVSTVLFNGNPLLRFDGYYILSDLLDIPNLTTRSKKHLRHLVERYAFGYKDSFSPAQAPKEAFWLTVFGVLSGIYRVVVFVGIILFVADKFLLAGLLMALICVISWGIVPLYRLIVYLASSPRLARTRARAIAVSVGALALLVSFLAVWPFPNRFRAPGVIESVRYVQVINDAPGYVKTVLVPSGARVRAGTALIELSDRELDLEIEATEAQRTETLAMQRRALRLETADLEPIRKRLETIESKLEDLKNQRDALLVRTRQSGIWVAPLIKDMVATWVPRGSTVGEIVNRDAFRFSAVVSQDEAADLFNGQIRKAEVRIHGQGGKNLEVDGVKIIPYQQERLPSAALGWYGGGEVPVSVEDGTGLRATEPFFQIYATVRPTLDPLLLHGRSGKLRFTLNPKPLLFQWIHKFKQLLQKRYQI